MRIPLVPARPPEELAGTPIHLIVRDYPETLAHLRRHGVDLSRDGGRPLAEVVSAGQADLIDQLFQAIAWRGEEGRARI